MKKFVHGTTYYHFANPRGEFEDNFKKMAEMGLNIVRVAEIWPGWEVLEPEPGRYDFDDLDFYINKAHYAGLNIIVGIGVNNPPLWVFNDIPDLRCIDAGGEVSRRRVQSANHDNPVYRALMLKFIKKIVSRYDGAPGVTAWQFGNEIRYGVDIADNECTRVKFRRWLKDKYGNDIEKLNACWGVHYRAWEEIYPYNSREGAPTWGLSPLGLASSKFQAWSIEEFIEWGIGIIRSLSDLPVFHNNFDISGQNGNHWNIDRNCDIIVNDIYPASSSEPQTYNSFLLDCAVSASMLQEKELWIGETSIGQYGTFHRDRPGQELIETLVVEMLGAGSKGILYFRHKAPKYEQPHKFTGSQYALRRDGSPTPYAGTVTNINKLTSDLGDRLMESRPVRPEVAIYFPEDSLLFSKIAGYDLLQQESCFGASSLWNRMGYPALILPARELIEEDLAGLKIIYLPLSYLMPEKVGLKLKEFVSKGGILISEARPAFVDDYGWLYENQPGAGLDEVFGVSEDLFWNEPSIKVESSFGSGVFHEVFQSFRLKGAKETARNDNGDIVGAENTFGKGRAFLFGFAPALLFPVIGHKYASGHQRKVAYKEQSDGISLLRGLLSHLNCSPPVSLTLSHHEASVRYLENKDELILFLLNYGPGLSVCLPHGFNILSLGAGAGAARPEEGNYVLQPSSWLVAARAKDKRFIEDP